MGIKERRVREKKNLKKRIVAVATEIFLQDGLEHTSMRAIARHIDYSVATIYLHYKDREEIINAIRKQGFHLLLTALKKVDIHEDDFSYLQDLAYTYVDFSFSHPAYYDVMFIASEPIAMDNDGKFNVTYKKLIKYFCDPLRHCIAQKKIQLIDAEQATLNLWALLHGLISLNLRNRLQYIYMKSDIKQLIRLCLDAHLSMMK